MENNGAVSGCNNSKGEMSLVMHLFHPHICSFMFGVCKKKKGFCTITLGIGSCKHYFTYKRLMSSISTFFLEHSQDL